MFCRKQVVTLTADEVICEERKFISEEKSKDEQNEIWGLGISGGGIRSASFGLGVLQALVNAASSSILSKIDYLSTVSGGGYIGSALTWFLQKGLPNGQPAGTDPENFPLGQKGASNRINPDTNLVLDYIRQHGNYLLPGSGLNALSLFGVTVRSMVVSLFVYLAMLTILLTVFIQIGFFRNDIITDIFGFNLPAIPLIIYIAFILLIILLLGAFTFSIGTSINISSERRYKYQITGQKFLGFTWEIIILLLLTGSLVYVSDYLPDIREKIIAGISSLGLGTILGFFQHKKSVDNSGSGGFPTIVIYLAAFALIYGLLLLAYSLGYQIHTYLVFGILVLLTLIFGILVNLNYVGLHRMYRNRLMETFLPNLATVINGKWSAATEADKSMLEDMCETHHRPYHLINTNIVLVDSPNEKYRGRGGDSFLLSKKFCGSDSTGYVATDSYMKKGGRGIALSTAMAISGAAVNPNTGSGGRGPTRNPLVSCLLGLLNLRLGYWAQNPQCPKRTPVRPNFFKPGLNGDILGGDLNEEKNDIQLTDGGHFENLGLYELVRRRAKLIILSDAGADPNYQFSDLANAIEKVRVDFGVKITFDDNYSLEKILPGSTTDKGPAAEKYQLAENGYAVAKIYYPARGNESDKDCEGDLIYIKSTLIKALPADIYGYKSANSAFPNETTANQFFNEEQFEAYRELGYQLTKEMINSKRGKKILKLKNEKND